MKTMIRIVVLFAAASTVAGQGVYYVSRTNSVSRLSIVKTEPAEFFTTHTPDDVQDGKIVWREWEPYAHRQRITLTNGYVVISTLYMKNTIRLITVVPSESKERETVVFLQHSFKGSNHPTYDEKTDSVRIVIGPKTEDRSAEQVIYLAVTNRQISISEIGPNHTSDGIRQSSDMSPKPSK